MLTLLIFFCLIYVLVGLLGLYSEAVLLMLSGFLVLVPQSPTPVSTPNTCIVTFFSFRRLPSVPSAFVVFSVVLPMLPVLRWRPHFQYVGTPKDLCELVLCHLASLCRLALMLFFGWCYVMVLILNIRVCHLCFLQQPWGLKTPQQSEDVGFVGELDWGEKCAPHLW